MISIPLLSITFDDVESFIEEKWPESKTLDYKRDAYGGRDEDKRELLKDVSSFANTQGGDILIGIAEDKGEPVEISGVSIADVDKEKLRLESIIRDGLEPRVDCAIHHVSTPQGSFVLIIRVRESLIAPHRVVFRGNGEFWARHSAGKYSMDTNQLRQAFTLTDSIYEQIRDFRLARVKQIVADETPMPLKSDGRFILHLIPTSSFQSRHRFDVATMANLHELFPPLRDGAFDFRLNLDGYVSYAGRDGDGYHSYTQFFRNGIVEAVMAKLIQEEQSKDRLLRPGRYEWLLTQHRKLFKQFISGLNRMGIQPPVWCFLSMTGVKGARIPTVDYFPDEHRTIDRDILTLPECVIDDLDADATATLRPIFDLVWNASGYSRSANFDSNGKWIGRS